MSSIGISNFWRSFNFWWQILGTFIPLLNVIGSVWGGVDCLSTYETSHHLPTLSVPCYYCNLGHMILYMYYHFYQQTANIILFQVHVIKISNYVNVTVLYGIVFRVVLIWRQLYISEVQYGSHSCPHKWKGQHVKCQTLAKIQPLDHPRCRHIAFTQTVFVAILTSCQHSDWQIHNAIHNARDLGLWLVTLFISAQNRQKPVNEINEYPCTSIKVLFKIKLPFGVKLVCVSTSCNCGKVY